jgi:hypothetical protein
MKRLIESAFQRFGLDVVKYRNSKLTKPTDNPTLKLLSDLDTARLANLWRLCRMSNPSGSAIEIGSYKGGGALHISNSCLARTIFVCDMFDGFGDLPTDPKFSMTIFAELMASSKRRASSRTPTQSGPVCNFSRSGSHDPSKRVWRGSIETGLEGNCQSGEPGSTARRAGLARQNRRAENGEPHSGVAATPFQDEVVANPRLWQNKKSGLEGHRNHA